MAKSALPLLFIFFIFHIAAHSQVRKDNVRQLTWLEGTWTGTNAAPGQTETEKWIKISAEEWQGLNVQVKGADTTFIEKMKIIVKNNSIYYIADVRENKAPVFFRFTSITDNSFVCENPEHDFPKKISYEVTGNKLKAVISGDGKSMEYFFEKKKN